MPDAYRITLETFCEVLESRKAGLNGSWFNVPGESLADCFMRRLKDTDPAKEVYWNIQ